MMMKALVKTASGPGNVELKDVPVPEVGPNDVKIRVRACGICGTDLHILHGAGWEIFPPITLGHEFSGDIVEAGDDVERWTVGDRVTAEPPAVTCGVCEHCITGYPALCSERRSIGSGVDGAFAEYLVVPQTRIHSLPGSVDYRVAALSEPAACCAHAVLETGRVTAGDTVLVTGPGPVGLIVSQLAKIQGGTVVLAGTADDRDRLALAERLGVDRTVVVGGGGENGETDGLEQALGELTGGRGADRAFECAGVYPAFAACARGVRKHGSIVHMGIFPGPGTADLSPIVKKELTIRGSFGSIHSSWERVLDLVGRGLVDLESLITETLPLERWERGFELMETRQACKVVLLPE